MFFMLTERVSGVARYSASGSAGESCWIGVRGHLDGRQRQAKPISVPEHCRHLAWPGSAGEMNLGVTAVAAHHIKVIKGDRGPTVTVEQAAALDFAAVKAFARMSKLKRAERCKNAATTVYNTAKIAAEILSKDKEALVTLVRRRV